MLRQHEIELRVRYQESDPMGFLHHANYFTYFELGRTELLRAAGGNYRQMEEEGLRVVVVKAECRFRQPARYDDVLRLRTTILRASGAKIEHQYELFRDGDLSGRRTCDPRRSGPQRQGPAGARVDDCEGGRGKGEGGRGNAQSLTLLTSIVW